MIYFKELLKINNERVRELIAPKEQWLCWRNEVSVEELLLPCLSDTSKCFKRNDLKYLIKDWVY